jgi:HEPN domain-containing protein
MTKEEKINYWIEISDYDKDTATAMLNTGRYLYVAFMCHQCIEKILKACYLKLKEDTHPYIHDLERIAIKGDFYNQFNDEQISFLEYLNPFNIEARYPEYKDKFSKTLSKENCERLLQNTKDFQQWIKENILSVK